MVSKIKTKRGRGGQKMKQFDKYFTIILREMFSRVGAEYDGFDFDRETWFSDYEWSEEEAAQFIDWLANYLYNNTKARREIMFFSYRNKRRCKKFASMFNFMWGWKYKKEESNG